MLVRRISLSVLAGVALLGIAAVLLHSARASLSRPAVPVSAQLVAAATGRLTSSSPQLVVSPGLRRQLSQFLLVRPVFALPSVRSGTGRRPSAVKAAPLVRPRLPDGMACPVAAGSGVGGCSIVPCTVYVGAAQVNGVPAVSALELAALPRVIRRPSPGGSTPAGTCVSRPGRPPQTLWVSAAGVSAAGP